MPATVEIYTTPACGYCMAAKRVLAKKGVEFAETDVWGDPEKRQHMMDRAHGGHTVPQIFINGRHVGGFNEMMELEIDGKLDPMLQESA